MADGTGLVRRPHLDSASLGIAELATVLRAGKGLAHKADLAPLIRRLGLSDGSVRVGDDCAAIPDGDGWLLLAIEGFLGGFVAADPWFAGWCGIMVNASDIYAMGGRPIAVVDAVWSDGAEAATPLLDGLKAASTRYGIPLVGGHGNLRHDSSQLSVAILGRASRLLTSFDAQPGELLLAAIDLRGAFREPHPYWDAASRGAEGARLRGDLELLPLIAEAGLSRAAKDISMAGLVGTALMLAEGSGIGMTIEPDRVPRPEGVPLERWLASFPSFGFLLTARPENSGEILTLFAQRGIACAVIGHCVSGTEIRLRRGTDEALFWDLDRAPLVGCGPS
jgi:AIR synthase-related protein